jgi:two-component system cell cycle response regulator DivK
VGRRPPDAEGDRIDSHDGDVGYPELRETLTRLQTSAVVSVALAPSLPAAVDRLEPLISLLFAPSWFILSIPPSCRYGSLTLLRWKVIALRTVLLVEDSKLLRVEREHTLKKAGYHVVVAVDGIEALNVARDNHPDLILLDMMLPKLDGPSVLRALKANALTAEIPVVVVTGLSQKNEERLLHDGAAAFVGKDQLLAGNEPLLCMIKKILGSYVV